MKKQQLNLLIYLFGLEFLDNPEHREWRPTGVCFYYHSAVPNQPVWWSYNLHLFRTEQKRHGGKIFNHLGEII